MDFVPNTTEKLMNVVLTLAQYPILSPRIRQRMREELFARGIIEKRSVCDHASSFMSARTRHRNRTSG